jgi:hypothetical protein
VLGHNLSGGERMRASRLSREQRLISLLLLLPCLTVGKTLNNDIWFILNCGRYVIQNGIPYMEPFTIHEGLSFVMQQWLTSVIFWMSYDIGRGIGLKILVLLVYILIIFITFKLCMTLSMDNFLVSFAVTLFATILISPFITERPYIFMFLITILEIYFLEKYINSNKIMFLTALPVLSTLLINLEAAIWPILFVILIPYFIDSFRFKFKFIEGQGFGKTNLVIAGLGMFAAGFVNPYGFSAMAYLFKSYGIDEISSWIIEMHCADINTTFGKVIFFTFLTMLISVVIYKKGNYRLRFILLALGTSYMALSSLRSFPTFVICGIIPMSFYFKDFEIKNIENKNDTRTLFIRKVLIIILIVMIGSLCIFKLKEPADVSLQELSSNVDYLENLNNKDMKLYTGYNYGGYLEFRGFKVYMDGRAEVFLKSNNKKDDIFIEYYKLQHGRIYYRDVLDKYDFDYLLVSDEEAIYYCLDYDGDYKLIHSSSHYKIYEHKK